MNDDFSITRRLVVFIFASSFVIFLRICGVLLIDMAAPGRGQAFVLYANSLAIALIALAIYCMLCPPGSLVHGNWWRKYLPGKEFWHRLPFTRRIHH